MEIFDSAVHPTVSGSGFGNNDTSFTTVVDSLRATKGIVARACALGLPGVGGYDPQVFYQKCLQYPELYPVAAVAPDSSMSAADQIQFLGSIGYRAVKLHSRAAGLDWAKHASFVNQLFVEAEQQGIVVFVCTYFAAPAGLIPELDPYQVIAAALNRAPKLKLVLLHGGVQYLLKYADLARFNPNVLLDLSYTLMKYQGSSLWQDMCYLSNTFDQRLCVGSDVPDFEMSQFLKVVSKLFDNLSPEKQQNIGYENLSRLLTVE